MKLAKHRGIENPPIQQYLILVFHSRVYNDQLDLLQIGQGHKDAINDLVIIPELNQVSRQQHYLIILPYTWYISQDKYFKI